MIDFSLPYSKSKPDFISFLEGFLPEDYKSQEEEINIPFQSKYFERAAYLGKSKKLDLSVYEVYHNSEHDARVGLTREMFRLMGWYTQRRALVILVPKNGNTYRFSLVTIDLKLDENEKITREYSNPKRYSFILGEGAKLHTPRKFLKDTVSNFEDLLQRFSVEVVNKEFYNQIALMFSRLVGGKRKQGSRTQDFEHVLELPSTPYAGQEQKYKEFAVRLIGRTVFCWFLKKKKSAKNIPLIPEDVLSTFAISFNPNYYHSRVEPLFFNVLNTPVNERTGEFKEKPYDNIPFLNGGLFEPQPDDFYAQNRPNYALKIPDEWWQDFIEILETYNFTIDENTSIDIDLSVDPEMLGRIFENLLAEINPETGETARKSTGSYYTPRPIVEYMVDESLKQYLVTKTGIEEENLETLLDYSREESGLEPAEEQKVVEALNKIKVLDPACGSGAFPMGILQKMLLILQKVDHEAQNSIQQILDDIHDPVYRKLLESKLKAAQVYDDDDLDDYARKLNIIRRSIYGVDIQPVAVDIAKLRFFLSIIVDEVIQDELPNRGIEPLPNLEFKFVCANTLIPLPPNRELFENADFIEKLEKLREQYFISFGAEKESIKKEFRKVQGQMFNTSIDLLSREPGTHNDRPLTQTQMLATWNPFSNETTKWFDPKWMFGNKEGVDVIIGNPPYINVSKLSLKKTYKEIGYQTYDSSGDIYCLFYEKSNNILSHKGIICFVTSNQWLQANYGNKLRKYFLNHLNPITLINFGGLKVFESATVDTNIFIGQKKKNRDMLRASHFKNDYNINIPLKKYFQKNSLTLSNLNDQKWIIADKKILQLKSKIKSVGIPLQEWNIQIKYGIKSGLNEAFIVDNYKKEQLIIEDKNSKKLLKPLLRGRDVHKHYVNWNQLYLLTIKNGIDINKFPAIYNHLIKFGERIRNRADQGENWWNLRACSYYDYFDKVKIIYPETTVRRSEFYLDTDGYYVDKTCFMITGGNLYYLLSILTSKLMEWYLESELRLLGKNSIQYSKQYIEKIPVPDSRQKYVLENAIKNRLKLTNSFNKIEAQIDLMVYKLYELTWDEALIVDPELPGIISREDYEKAGMEELAEWEIKEIS